MNETIDVMNLEIYQGINQITSPCFSSMWRIIHVLDGEIHLLADTTIYHGLKDDIFIVAKDTLLSIYANTSSYVRVFSFDERVLWEPLSEFDTQFSNVFLLRHQYNTHVIDENSSIYQQANHILYNMAEEWMAKDVCFSLIIRGMLFELVGTIFRDFGRGLEGYDAEEIKNALRLKNAVTYMKEHCDKPMTVSEMASYASLSTGYFEKLIRKICNKSAYEFVSHVRFMSAMQLVLNTSDSLLQIASACGFSNPGYFTELCKRYYDCTPQDFRKKEISWWQKEDIQ